MDRASIIAVQPDVLLILLAFALAFATGFVSLSIYGHACARRPDKRLRWLLLAGASFAFGFWCAHLIALTAHTSLAAKSVAWSFTVVSLSSLTILACLGFATAVPESRWRQPVGGAANGIGVGTMHLLGLSAVGLVDWNPLLIIASLGTTIGLNSAAFVSFRKLRGTYALWIAATLVTLGFIGLHFGAVGAIAGAPETTTAVGPGEHERIFALIVAGAGIVTLGFALATQGFDSRRMRDNDLMTQELVDAAIEGIAVTRQGRIISANRGLAEMCGVPAEDLIGKLAEGELLKQGDDEAAVLCGPSGRSVPVRLRRQRLSCGDEVYAIHDLTERLTAEEELQRRNTELVTREEELSIRNIQFNTALSHMSQGLCMYDQDGRLVVCNDRYATLFGLAPDAVKPGMKRAEVVALRIANGLWGAPSKEDYLRERTKPIRTNGFSIQEMNDGRYIASTHQPMPNGGWVCTHEDVTERQLAQARIEHLARHDVLTDLPNRNLLREVLQEALTDLRGGAGIAVHCIDLDRFKEVNDALGSALGDELLKAFGARLRRIVDDAHVVARTGGDEFVIVQQHASSPTDATELAGRIIASMAEPFSLGDHSQVVVSASIGIAMGPGDGKHADPLLTNSNLALSRAKQNERGNYCFFEMDMDARMRARHHMECNLRHALANGELDVDFQPLLNLRRNEVSCFETLVRWRPPDRAEIAPADFIPLAEETALIIPIGEWVLRRALEEAAKWPSDVRVAVNLSPVQFGSRNLAQVIMGALAASGVGANRLELEITESVLMEDRDTTFGTLHQLRDLGVRIALDDFGTGFSSLGYLRSFPFDKIKIDKSFVADLSEGCPESLAVLRAVAQLGSNLGVTTVAEGVETEQQLDIVNKEGFTEAQGFLIGRPKGADAITREHDLHPSVRPSRRPSAPREKRVKPPSDESSGGSDVEATKGRRTVRGTRRG